MRLKMGRGFPDRVFPGRGFPNTESKATTPRRNWVLVLACCALLSVHAAVAQTTQPQQSAGNSILIPATGDSTAPGAQSMMVSNRTLPASIARFGRPLMRSEVQRNNWPPLLRQMNS